MGWAVQNPDTPYWIFLGLALLCGFGGGNFASSMANISFFFPKAEKGNALAINAGLGNLGVSVVQFVVPLAITAGVFGWLGGDPQTATVNGVTTTLWLQNAGYVFVPFIIASAFAAWFGMNDIATMKASFADQAVIFSRLHNWIMCWLYTGTFGSFIGFSAAFPLLSKILFPEVNALKYAFLGPLVGAVSRAVAGKACDRIGGGRITFWVFIAMSVGVLGILYAIGMKGSASAFPVFFASFLFLFAATGVGNASTFQMIPAIMRKEVARLEPGLSPADRVRQSDKEAAAIIGFTSAIAAYGAFFIPKSFGTSIALTGGAQAALYGFLAFYVSCIAITWWFYTRPGGLLFDVEHGGRQPRLVGDTRRNDQPRNLRKHSTRPSDMSHFLDRLTFFKKATEPFSNGHGITTNEDRRWEDGYRKRWQHDKIVRSTHGANCTGSCSWKIYVKGGIVTWETQQTDYPRTRPDLPNHEPRGCSRGRQLQLVSLLGQPREVSADPLAAAAALARGAQDAGAGRRLEKHRRGPGQAERLHPGARPRRLRARQVGRGHRDHRRRQRLYGQDLRPRSRRRLLADPGHVDGLLRGRLALSVAARRRLHVVLRLVLRPAAG